MSMPQAVRHINETRALEALFRGGPMSRAELARRLGLTRSTASSIVADLVGAGLVAEDTNEPQDRGSRTGRPGQFAPNTHHAVFIGADIGVGHETVIAVMTPPSSPATRMWRCETWRCQPSLTRWWIWCGR